MVFHWFYNKKTETCVIMEREARKVQEQEHTGNRIIKHVLKDDKKPEEVGPPRGDPR